MVKSKIETGKKHKFIKAPCKDISIEPTSDREQYINLEEDTSHLEYGRKVKVKSQIKPKVAGVKVYWSFESASSNKTGLPSNKQAGFGSPGTTTTNSSTDANGVAEINFYLSQYGGDEFVVKASTKSDGSDVTKSGKLIVWQKLYFEVDTMKQASGTGVLEMSSEKLPDSYKKAFVILEQQGKDNKPDNERNLKTSELHDFANLYFGAEKSPFQFQEVAVDHQADEIEGSISDTMEIPVYIDDTERSYYVYDKDPWIKSAEYNDGTGWKDLDTTKISLEGTNKVYKKIKIDLSKGPVMPSASSPVEVEIKYREADEYSGDGSKKPHAIIAMGYWYDTESDAEAKKRTVGTMAHELGHLVGMVPSTSSTYIKTKTGKHCSDSSCVMYSTNTDKRGNEFCGVCIDVLRGLDLSKAKIESTFKHTKGAKA